MLEGKAELSKCRRILPYLANLARVNERLFLNRCRTGTGCK
jgi:hypothetical protein